ncbi:MAG: 16S rRNA (guanine(527)-N(7))-methyltransferase RsmG [Schleiferiaceae bacterium]|nr:16S rRNA (guanine(527)-N(7))-methyltransferase RsmG [Schleiferiaceae bacterium]
MNIIQKYFPDITSEQIEKFDKMQSLYKEWNSKINVVSRKDIDELNTRHILHSLGIAKVIQFKDETAVLDVGTGGGFPGIPLAVMFPNVHFHLVDSIGKKIKVVNAVAEGLGLENVEATHTRVQDLKHSYDFVVSRAVTNMSDFTKMVKGRIERKGFNRLRNGIIYLKGGDLAEELAPFSGIKIFELPEYFEEDFFDTKKVVHLPYFGFKR